MLDPTSPAQMAAAPRVLVLDDDELVADAIARWLSEFFDVTVEVDPLRAIERIVEGTSYDAILCDMRLGWLSGIEFYRTLAGIAPEQKDRVVFMTGGDADREYGGFLRATGRDCVEKPFSPTWLIERLARAFARTEPIPRDPWGDGTAGPG